MKRQGNGVIAPETAAKQIIEAAILGGGGVLCPHCGYFTDCVFVGEEISCENCRKVFLVTDKKVS